MLPMLRVLCACCLSLVVLMEMSEWNKWVSIVIDSAYFAQPDSGRSYIFLLHKSK
jgi:hypothetical protein